MATKQKVINTNGDEWKNNLRQKQKSGKFSILKDTKQWDESRIKNKTYTFDELVRITLLTVNTQNHRATNMA